jgi:hypothetical protein
VLDSFMVLLSDTKQSNQSTNSNIVLNSG